VLTLGAGFHGSSQGGTLGSDRPSTQEAIGCGREWALCSSRLDFVKLTKRLQQAPFGEVNEHVVNTMLEDLFEALPDEDKALVVCGHLWLPYDIVMSIDASRSVFPDPNLEYDGVGKVKGSRVTGSKGSAPLADFVRPSDYSHTLPDTKRLHKHSGRHVLTPTPMYNVLCATTMVDRGAL